MSLTASIGSLYSQLAKALETAADRWLLGLGARLVFLAVLFFYFMNSFQTKIGEGFAGFFSIQASALFQIVPLAVDAAGGDTDAVSFFPWKLIVFAGTYTEALLPLLIVLGLLTRLAALAMIGFITVQSLVDVFGHHVEAATIGALFDRFPDSVILDQRALWVFLLLVLVTKGAGLVSLDRLFFKQQ